MRQPHQGCTAPRPPNLHTHGICCLPRAARLRPATAATARLARHARNPQEAARPEGPGTQRARVPRQSAVGLSSARFTSLLRGRLPAKRATLAASIVQGGTAAALPSAAAADCGPGMAQLGAQI